MITIPLWLAGALAIAVTVSPFVNIASLVVEIVSTGERIVVDVRTEEAAWKKRHPYHKPSVHKMKQKAAS